jgi:hypothetical protein
MRFWQRRRQARLVWNREVVNEDQRGEREEPDWLGYHCREQAYYELVAWLLGMEYEWVEFEPEKYPAYWGRREDPEDAE